MDLHGISSPKQVNVEVQFFEIFQQYWRRGGLPSSPELLGLRSFETEMEGNRKKKGEEIERIDEELKRITAQRSNLIQESDKAAALIRVSQSFRSPIRSLPTEVLCRIFQFYIPVSAGHDMETPACAAPVILGQVCKYWRDVSCSDRSLWSRLRIDLGSHPRPQLQWAIDTHVDRAATEVLAINITSSFRPSTPQWLSWISKILEVISRCTSFWLSCRGRHLSWLGSLPVVFRRLESIFFRAQSDFSSNSRLDLSTALNLQSAHLEVALPEELFWFTFSPTTLRDLTCILSRFVDFDPSRSINAWRSFVQQYRDLRSVRVRFLGSLQETILTTDSIMSFDTPVAFTQARALSIGIDSQADISAILLNLEFPSLEDLEVVAIKTTTNPTLLYLLSTPAVNPNLTTLRLIRFNVKSTEFYSLFRSTTMLTSLDILNGRLGTGPKRFVVDDDELVHKLTIAIGETPLLPHLRHLQLYIKESKRYSVDENTTRYARLVDSRYNWSASQPDPYPFRLSLKYEDGDKHTIPVIAAKLGLKAYPILFPQFCDSFALEV